MTNVVYVRRAWTRFGMNWAADPMGGGRRSMIRRVSWLSALLVLALGVSGCNSGLVLDAQTLPATVHASWNPNPAADNVVSYKVTLDAGTPQIVLPAACTPVLCTATVSVPTGGSHTISVVASNLAYSWDPTTTQDSAAATAGLTVNVKGSAPAGLTLKP